MVAGAGAHAAVLRVVAVLGGAGALLPLAKRILEADGKFQLQLSAVVAQEIETALDELVDVIVIESRAGVDLFLRVVAASRRLNFPLVFLVRSRGDPIGAKWFLDEGADACLTASTSPDDLRAHLEALIRRRSLPATVRCGSLALEPSTRNAVLRGTRIWLSAKEFDTLFLLASAPGKHVSLEELGQRVWGHADATSHDVYRHVVRSLRRKLEALENAPIIRTVWGSGYLLET